MKQNKKIFSLQIGLILLLATAQISAEDSLKSAINTEIKSQNETQQSQQKINTLANETEDLAQEYKTLLRSIDGLETYNNQLEKLVSSQNANLKSIQRQLGHIEDTQRNIVPLMLRMIEVLEEFILLDMPFLKVERQNRLGEIKAMMDRPDVTLPDKFRRIMEAYQIEMEYGRTIEAYTDTIEVDGKSQTVDLLRIGRIGLLYMSLDQSSVGEWDKFKKVWHPLDSSYSPSVSEGIKIARKQAPPDLFKIPVSAPEAAK